MTPVHARHCRALQPPVRPVAVPPAADHAAPALPPRDPALELGAKLLRVVEDRKFERLGGSRTLTLEARIVASASAEEFTIPTQVDGYERVPIEYVD